MRLPQRVPWSTLGELDELCSWIYTDDSDINAKINAIDRLAAWRATTPLPYALEATHGILSAVIQDVSHSQSSTRFLSLRQSYSAGIIRLVNGLVDPLQSGAYARSISSIAAQLGLPAWLVELRHAATHEDLPSVEVLRVAARTALEWLLNNYFLPTLNLSTTVPDDAQPLPPLEPLLKRYKSVQKVISRDASLKPHFKSETGKIYREIERWIAEVKIGVDMSEGTFDFAGTEDTAQAAKERRALELLCDGLLDRAGLIPVSKRKRTVSPQLELAPTLLAVWSPLLSHLKTFHPTLPSVLVTKSIAHITSTPTLSEKSTTLEGETISLVDVDHQRHKQETSYNLCLAGWVKWIVDNWGAPSVDDDDETSEGEAEDLEQQASVRRRDVVVSLATSLRPTGDHNEQSPNNKITRTLLKALCVNHPSLEQLVALVSIPQLPNKTQTVWQETDLSLMNDRLQNLVSITSRSFNSTPGGNEHEPDVRPQRSLEDMNPIDGELLIDRGTEGISKHTDVPNTDLLPIGWRKIDGGDVHDKVAGRDGWRASPLGVYGLRCEPIRS